MKNLLKSLFLLILVLATSVLFLACAEPESVESTSEPTSEPTSESVSESETESEEPQDPESNYEVTLPEVDRM